MHRFHIRLELRVSNISGTIREDHAMDYRRGSSVRFLDSKLLNIDKKKPDNV